MTSCTMAIDDLETMSDEDFNKTWIVRRGDQMRREMPKRLLSGVGDLVILYITGVNYQFTSACWMFPCRVCMVQVLMKNDRLKKFIHE